MASPPRNLQAKRALNTIEAMSVMDTTLLALPAARHGPAHRSGVRLSSARHRTGTDHVGRLVAANATVPESVVAGQSETRAPSTKNNARLSSGYSLRHRVYNAHSTVLGLVVLGLAVRWRRRHHKKIGLSVVLLA